MYSNCKDIQFEAGYKYKLVSGEYLLGRAKGLIISDGNHFELVEGDLYTTNFLSNISLEDNSILDGKQEASNKDNSEIGIEFNSEYRSDVYTYGSIIPDLGSVAYRLDDVKIEEVDIEATNNKCGVLSINSIKGTFKCLTQSNRIERKPCCKPPMILMPEEEPTDIPICENNRCKDNFYNMNTYDDTPFLI
jgi:hypothetical protein